MKVDSKYMQAVRRIVATNIPLSTAFVEKDGKTVFCVHEGETLTRINFSTGSMAFYGIPYTSTTDFSSRMRDFGCVVHRNGAPRTNGTLHSNVIHLQTNPENLGSSLYKLLAIYTDFRRYDTLIQNTMTIPERYL